MINFIGNFFLYISIPLLIRYVILKKPITSKWVTLGVLVFIFVGFSILINIQRDDLQGKLDADLNIPYTPKTHMVGSPLLYVAMAISYSILRRGNSQLHEKKSQAFVNIKEKVKELSYKSPVLFIFIVFFILLIIIIAFQVDQSQVNHQSNEKKPNKIGNNDKTSQNTTIEDSQAKEPIMGYKDLILGSSYSDLITKLNADNYEVTENIKIVSEKIVTIRNDSTYNYIGQFKIDYIILTFTEEYGLCEIDLNFTNNNKDILDIYKYKYGDPQKVNDWYRKDYYGSKRYLNTLEWKHGANKIYFLSEKDDYISNLPYNQKAIYTIRYGIYSFGRYYYERSNRLEELSEEL